MEPRERIDSVLKHREPDRTPIFEYVLLSPVADGILGRKCADFAGDKNSWEAFVREKGWENALRQCAVDRLELAEILEHDMLYAVPNPLPPGTETVCPAPADLHGTDDPVERLIRRNRKEEQDLEELEPAVYEKHFLIYCYLKEEMRRRDLDLPILAPAYFHGIWTDVDLMQTMLLEPDVAGRHFEIATRRAVSSIERYVALGIDQIGIGGDFAGNRLLISPQSYREFIVPELKKLSELIHKEGRHAVSATDGDIWPVIDDFLIGCDVDGYIEIDMRAGMNLRKLKKIYGDRITFYGNMDCGEILSFCSADEIRNYTVECIESGLGNGGHIFCASNAITGSISQENYMAMVNAYREYFGMEALNIN